jgi:Ala-tRNA(Pro) deacylase
MGVINDPEHRVEVIVDRAVWHAEQVRCHPLVNTATLVLKRADMHRLFELTGHQPIILDVPTC